MIILLICFVNQVNFQMYTGSSKSVGKWLLHLHSHFWKDDHCPTLKYDMGTGRKLVLIPSLKLRRGRGEREKRAHVCVHVHQKWPSLLKQPEHWRVAGACIEPFLYDWCILKLLPR